MKTLGKVKRTNRHFEIVEFRDHYDKPCELQASSLAIYEKPGTSAVWLGITDTQPLIRAEDAKRLGVSSQEADKLVGEGFPLAWVPYHIPPEVLMGSSMHLNRDQVEALIGHLKSWLKHDTFKIQEKKK